jgi:hypothetical protein
LAFFLLVFIARLASAQSATGPLPPLAPADGQLAPTFWEQHGTTVITAGFAFMAVAAAVLWVSLQTRPPVAVPPEVLAREALLRLRGRPEGGQVLSEISQLLRRYVLLVLGRPQQELTTAEISAALAGSDKIGAELAEAVTVVLRECDQRKFSPLSPPAPLNAADRALAIVEAMEKQRAKLGFD